MVGEVAHPVGRRAFAISAVPFRRGFWPLFPRIAEVADQKRGCVVDERSRLGFVDIGQVLPGDFAWRGVGMPVIGAMRVGMNSVHHRLLAVAQNLELFRLAVGRG